MDDAFEKKKKIGFYEKKYFWMYVVGLILSVGINANLFFVLISLGGVYVLKKMYEEESVAIDIDKIEAMLIFLITGFVVPYFLILSIIVIPYYLLKIDYKELLDALKIHTFIGVFSISVISLLSLILYAEILKSIIGVFFGAITSIFVGTLIGLFIYFKIFLKFLKTEFYHEFNFYALWISYSILMSLIVVLKEVM
ncbi:MAG: hypothetical protein GXN99_03435 [Candidatus Nanohaloarchaeota archaeon]|nr:hypothetical protein [Candidatus Nanohaloarchaeota archaeon]